MELTEGEEPIKGRRFVDTEGKMRMVMGPSRGKGKKWKEEGMIEAERIFERVNEKE